MALTLSIPEVSPAIDFCVGIPDPAVASRVSTESTSMFMSQRLFVRMLVLQLLLCLTGNVALCREPQIRKWTVDGVAREALVYLPTDAASKPAPLVFGFHGHGGSMSNAAKTFRIHELWPEAIVVYMQGLKTPGQLTDPEGRRSGWQKTSGDQQDRDLKFFDEVLRSLRKEFRVDDARIYSTGHSNGGGFTYLLWAERGDVFAAMAPSGAAAYRLRDRLKPKPVLHIAGTNDPLVRYEWQKQMIDILKSRQQCQAGVPWQGRATLFASPIHAPVVTLLTEQGHKYPTGAAELTVRFFQDHPRRDSAEPTRSAPQSDAVRKSTSEGR